MARAHEQALRTQRIQVDGRRDTEPGDDPQTDSAQAGVAAELALQDQRPDRPAGGRDQDARDDPDNGVQGRRRAEHPSALGPVQGPGHRPHGRARHAVAQHEQVSGQRGHEPVGAELRHRQASRQHRHDHQQDDEAARLGDLLHERPGCEQAGLAGPRRTRRTAQPRAQARVGCTLPGRRHVPSPVTAWPGRRLAEPRLPASHPRGARRADRGGRLRRRHRGDGRPRRRRRARLRLRRAGARADGRPGRPGDARRATWLHAGRPGRDADRVGVEPAGRGARRPRLRARADAPLQRPLRRARSPRLALRRPRPGLARPACPVDAAPPPRHQGHRRLLAPLPAADAGRGGRDRRGDQRRQARRPLGRDRRAQAGEVDGAHARASRRAGDVRRRRRLRLPRRPHLDGARLDAGARPRVDLPDRPGAAPVAAALPLHEPSFRGRHDPSVPQPRSARSRR